jgi:hypothetical protein
VRIFHTSVRIFRTSVRILIPLHYSKQGFKPCQFFLIGTTYKVLYFVLLMLLCGLFFKIHLLLYG